MKKQPNNMYSLYHIKGVKWGCSNRLNERLLDQNYTLNDVCEVIEIDDVDMASNMEKELNIRDGYGWNKSKDYRRVLTMVDKAKGLGAKTQIENKVGMYGYSVEERRELNTKSAPKGGMAQSQVIRKCPHCGKVGKGNGMFCYHFDKCRYKS